MASRMRATNQLLVSGILSRKQKNKPAASPGTAANGQLPPPGKARLLSHPGAPLLLG